MCNQNFTFLPTPTEIPPVNGNIIMTLLGLNLFTNSLFTAKAPEEEPDQTVKCIVIVALVCSLVVMLVVCGLCYYKRHKFQEVSTTLKSNLEPQNNMFYILCIQWGVSIRSEF